ncbi:MAG: hypothetical protein Q9182_001046 [Xanthomendoza sp. 2 TL-2023]
MTPSSTPTNDPEQSSTSLFKRKATELPDEALNNTAPHHEVKKSKVDSPAPKISASTLHPPASSTSSTPNAPSPQAFTRPPPPTRGNLILPPPKDWRAIPNPTRPQRSGTSPSAFPSPNSPPPFISSTPNNNNKNPARTKNDAKPARKNPAQILQEARNALVEAVRQKDPNRYIPDPSHAAAVSPLPRAPSPPPQSSPVSPLSLSPSDEDLDPHLVQVFHDESMADFAGFVRGKQDFEGEEWGRRGGEVGGGEELVGGEDGIEVACEEGIESVYEEGTSRTLAEQESEKAAKAKNAKGKEREWEEAAEAKNEKGKERGREGRNTDLEYIKVEGEEKQEEA